MNREELLCNRCRQRVVLCAYSEGKCKCCGEQILCVNTPPDALCLPCALKQNRCIHCGKELEV